MKRHEVLASGIFTGVAGGIVMMAMGMIAATAQGIPPVHPLEVIGESFVGPEALDGTAAKAAFGALVFFLTAAGLGIVFAAIAPRELGTSCAMGLGAGIALFAMGVMMSAIVPWVNPGFRDGFQVIGGWWVVAHAVFGVILGTAPPFRRWLSRETSDAISGPELVRARAAPTTPTS